MNLNSINSSLSLEVVKKPSAIVIIATFLFSFWFIDFWKPYNTAKKETNFVYDVFGYYSYLPATFLNHGSFAFEDAPSGYNPLGPLNTYVPKYTYGMAILYAPYFALGYKIAYNQQSPLNGFSEPFATSLRWGSIFYVIFGLILLRKFLLIFFNEWVTAITLALVLFGTNLFIYTFNQSEMTHGYLFFLFSAFLWVNYKWHQHQQLKYTILLGLLISLISLIRPTEIYIALFFVFWDVKSLSDAKSKFSFFYSNWKSVLIILVLSSLLWIPQLYFYKIHTGTYFYFSYGGERFFWNDPQILNILFSYRKGWLVYTPLAFLALCGYFFLKKDVPISKWLFMCVSCITIYVYSCWWDWGFGGSFGARQFSQQFAFLALPIASVLDKAIYSNRKTLINGILYLMVLVFCISTIFLNLGQSYQYHNLMKIHVSGMSKEVYWNVFRKYQFSEQDQAEYFNKLNHPNVEKYMDGTGRDK